MKLRLSSLALVSLVAARCAMLPCAASEAFSTHVTVVRTEHGHHVDSSFAGFSYEKSALCSGLFDAGHTAQVALFRRLGPGVLRIGGAYVDETTWDPAGKINGYPAIAPADVDRLAAFLRACGWRVIYAVRFVNNTPAAAANEAAYAAKVLGDRLFAFEIGNEPDHYAYLERDGRRHFLGPINTYDGRFRPKGWGASDFYREWSRFADAIVAAVPGAALVGPSGGGGGVDKQGRNEGWAKTFAEMDAHRLSLLTTHYYLGGARDPDVATMSNLLRSAEPRLSNVLARMHAWSTAARVPGGFDLDECNSFSGGGKSGLSDAYASALWAVKFLFTCAADDACRGVNLHGGGHGSYTPIAYRERETRERGGGARKPMSGAIDEVRPEYYGLALFNLAVGGSIQPTRIAGPNPGDALSAYAVAGDDRSTRVVLVNTSDAATFAVSVDFSGPMHTATFVRLTGTSLSALSGTRLDGAAFDTDGSWSPQPEAPQPTPGGTLTVRVPPFSALLVTAR